MLTKIFFQALKMLTIVQNFCGFFTSFQISTIHDTATRTPITYKIEEAKGSQKLSLKTWIWQTVESFIFGQQLAMNWQVLCPTLNTIFLSQLVLWFWNIQISFIFSHTPNCSIWYERYLLNKYLKITRLFCVLTSVSLSYI